MASNRTEKSRYLSNYGEPGESLYVTAAQYLAEIACERQAARSGEKLPPRFWREKRWAVKFRAQVTHANGLLGKFPCGAILQALRHKPDGVRIYSLGLKAALIPLCERFNKTVIENPVMEITVDVTQGPRKPAPKNNLRSKLRE